MRTRIQLLIVFVGTGAVSTWSWAQVPLADYGDAPDPSYPSRYVNGGPYHLDTTREWLGPGTTSTTTLENDSRQVNNDLDDANFFYSTGTGIGNNWIHTTVSYNPALGSASDPRYLNLLVDRDASGSWDGGRREWLVRNYQVRLDALPAGVTTAEVFIKLPADADPAQLTGRTTRLALTTTPVADGTGRWGEQVRGETEDYAETLVNNNPADPLNMKFFPVRDVGPGRWIQKSPFIDCVHGDIGANTPVGGLGNVYDWAVSVPNQLISMTVRMDHVPEERHAGCVFADGLLLAPGGGGIINLDGGPVNIPVASLTQGQVNVFTGFFGFPAAPGHDGVKAKYNMVYDPDGTYLIVSNDHGVPHDQAFDGPPGHTSPGEYGYETALLAAVPEPGTFGLLTGTALATLCRRRRPRSANER